MNAQRLTHTDHNGQHAQPLHDDIWEEAEDKEEDYLYFSFKGSILATCILRHITSKYYFWCCKNKKKVE